MRTFRLFAIFASGILIGWLARGGSPAQTKEDVSQSSGRVPRRRDAISLKSSQESTPTSFGKRMSESDGGKFSQLWDELPPSDRRAALESMASQAGMDHMASKNRVQSMMGLIIAKWVNVDLDGALATARGTSNEDLQAFMIRAIMEQLVKKDPDKVFALEQEFPQTHSRYSMSLTEQALREKIKAGALEYVGAMEKFKFSTGSSGSPSQFPENFDFGTAADGVARLMASRDGLKPPSFPSNFYSEWAKKDPESAFDWWATNPSLPFNHLVDIISAVDTTSSGSSASWIATKLQVGATRAKILQELGANSGEALPLRIEAISMALPDVKSSDAFLADFLRENTNPKLDRQYSMAFVVSSISSPQARLEAFRTVKAEGRTLPTKQFTDAQFETWGITRSEVEEIFKVDE